MATEASSLAYDLYEQDCYEEEFNLTDEEECSDQDLPYSYIYIPVLYSVAFLIGFFGNMFVIFLMAKKQGTRRLVDTFVINLAMADLVFLCTLPLWIVKEALEQRWYFGDALCKISSFIIMVNRCSSILFLTGMSVDRYLAIVKMLDFQCVRTRKCILTACISIWAISVFMGIPSLTFRRVWTEEETSSTYCMEETSTTVYSIQLSMLLLTFALPLATILFCYCSIFVRLSMYVYPGKRSKNSLKIIFTIVGAFIFSWLPFNLVSTIFLFHKLQWTALSCATVKTLRWSRTITTCFAFMNSCVNPVIYLFLDRYFRRQIMRKTFS